MKKNLLVAAMVFSTMFTAGANAAPKDTTKCNCMMSGGVYLCQCETKGEE